jgi:hypothetical protein
MAYQHETADVMLSCTITETQTMHNYSEIRMVEQHLNKIEKA